jgi:ABC-type uncharacterized transport system permease subunit
MQRQHLKMLTASLALLLVGVFVLVVVLLVGGGGGDRGTRDNPNGATTDTDALSDFCWYVHIFIASLGAYVCRDGSIATTLVWLVPYD